MKTIMKFWLVCLTAFFMQCVFAATDSPIGYWKTIDDVTGKPKAIIQITETQDQSVSGRVVKIFPRPGYDQNEVCSACEGDKHNKRIVGLVILENMKQDKDTPSVWAGGQILDPKNGKVYKCTMQVVEGGKKLNVKGYIGLPAFGRSQTWIRVQGTEA